MNPTSKKQAMPLFYLYLYCGLLYTYKYIIPMYIYFIST